MTLKVRMVVTGHDASGKAVVASDEVLTAVARRIGSDITGCEIWSTDRMPVDNSREADAAQRKGYVVRHNSVGSGQGTTCRITEFAPGHGPFPHRTETVDYAILLSGEIDMALENDEVVHLKAGDVVVQRGTMHTWLNKGTVPAVFAFILIDAKPAEVNGEVLRTVY